MKFKTRLKLKTNIIEPVPLLDIILQIIIFFVLATQFIGRPGLVLQLPASGTTALYKESTARVVITSEKLYFQGEEITIAKLREELGKGLTSMLVIEADSSVPHKRIVEVIDLAQRMGVASVAIATEGER